MRVSFLFWNLKKLPRAEIVARLAHEHAVDVLILAEYEMEDEYFRSVLETVTTWRYEKPWSESTKIHIFSRLEQYRIDAVFDDESRRLTVRRLRIAKADLLLAAVHLQAKVGWSDEEQRAALQSLTHDLSRIEDEAGHRRTILVGDFNMNPFEKGMISSHGLHAVASRQIAEERTRKVAGRQYPFFYNPMWGLLGDTTPGPAGTHYFRKATPDIYFWNIFDQVLIRPDLMRQFQGDLEIVTTVGDTSLLTTRGFPDVKIGSDHLPVRFSLEL